MLYYEIIDTRKQMYSQIGQDKKIKRYIDDISHR